MMVPRRTAAYIALAAAAVLAGVSLFMVGRRYTAMTAPRAGTSRPPAERPAPPGRKIKARLFYVNEAGIGLTGVERDIAYGETTADQAREIITAQLAPAAEPLVSAVPGGTQLRGLFVTDDGEAFVDLSRELVGGHPGGSVNELLTVYTLVNVLTANLPAIATVQLLVDGKQLDTLAGHVNLRRPLAKNLTWVQ
jgi:hypothetical protein